MEDKVTDVAKRLMSGKQEFCTCERCQLDLVALALNQGQSKYVVNDKGGVVRESKSNDEPIGY